MDDKSALFGVYCAIDLSNLDEALALAEKISPYVAGFKLGLEFYAANGPGGVIAFKKLGKPIFLDLKLFDIDNTVFSAMKNLAGLGVDFVTIHASGGRAMIKAARDGVRQGTPIGQMPPSILAVTVLTSISQEDIAAGGSTLSVEERVLALSELALTNGADGLVSSGHEVAAIRRKYGIKPILVVPGLRLNSDLDRVKKDDQKRVMTPAEAWNLGGNLLVVGRPITQAKDPAQAAKKIAETIGGI
ncbi:MAG: orotidine-5'-phosphate decarboxylase [Alphaproteobacteria bacterium]|nr:orotidine-5'-phosphate decarboxylase [Alphaproteobacteria bacterium]